MAGRPWSSSGTIGSGGALTSASPPQRASGASAIRSRYARITAPACSRGQSSMPPSTSGPTGRSANSNSSTIPKLPPPPRSAQNRSAFSVAEAVTTWPSAVSTRAARRLSAARPILRSSQPLPEPSVKPATPVLDTRPPVTARPCSCVAASSSLHSTPGWTQAIRRAGSTWIAFSGLRSITRPPSVVANPAAEWPPARTATSSSCSRAYASAAATSDSDSQRAISAGRRSTIAL